MDACDRCGRLVRSGVDESRWGAVDPFPSERSFRSAGVNMRENGAAAAFLPECFGSRGTGPSVDRETHDALRANANQPRNSRMRPGQNKRMRGRNRRGPNPLTRSYESNGPDVKVRGTAQHIAEKYTQLARDAHLSGDPVAAESYLQHAEHYYRLIASAVQAQQAAINGTTDDRDDDDDDFDPSSDRFTFRSPQSVQQQNQGYGQGGERPAGEGEGLTEGEGGEAPPRHSSEGGFQPRPPRDDRRGGRHERDRFRGERGERGGERFQPPPRRPVAENDGTGDQPDLPAFLMSPARSAGAEGDVDGPPEAGEGDDGGRGPFRHRRRRRTRTGRPGEPGGEGGEGGDA